MGFFDKIFGSKEQAKVENKNEILDNVQNLNCRDSNKNSSFFYNYLKKIEENGRMYENFRTEYEANHNNSALSKISRNLSSTIYMYISTWYSMGKPIDYTWQKFYKEYFKYYHISISKDLINGSYQHSLKILSLGILLGIDKENFKKISERYIEEGYEDYILDHLIHSQYPSHPISTQLQFSDEIYIQKLAQILKSSSVQESETLAKESLENYFYTKENLQTSYDSHKTEFYSGYWAWEIAAIVKILALDDNSFKDNPYYPYDIVHWLDNDK